MKSKLLVVILFCTSSLFAQESTRAFIGYYGETLAHPGLNLGIEHYPYQSEKYQMILSANIGGFVHVRNNSSLFLRGQWGQRLTFNSGVILDNFLGIGYMHSIAHGGEVFKVLPNGAIVENKSSGNSLIMPSIGIGTGYDFSNRTDLNMVLYVRPELFWKAPFNGYYLTNVAINCGIIFNIPGHEK